MIKANRGNTEKARLIKLLMKIHFLFFDVKFNTSLIGMSYYFSFNYKKVSFGTAKIMQYVITIK